MAKPYADGKNDKALFYYLICKPSAIRAFGDFIAHNIFKGNKDFISVLFDVMRMKGKSMF